MGLMVVDVADPANPYIVTEKTVVTPYGLSIRDSLLYLANGQSGFSLYRVTNRATPTLLNNWVSGATKDFIWSDSLLIVMGFTDVRIMDATDPRQPVLLSTLP